LRELQGWRVRDASASLSMTGKDKRNGGACPATYVARDVSARLDMTNQVVEG